MIPGTILVQLGCPAELACDDDQRRCQQASLIQVVQQRLARLSGREQEVMGLMVSGLTCKEIAQKLGISPRTVEVHRTHVMHKMAAANLAELVNMAATCRP